jgi:NAD(P)-dependent dehydrogenase (short-subunit alcohol dehydrogenase family)
LLDGKIGLVTGGGSGMGRAAALAMAKQGARLVLVGREIAKLEKVREEIAAAGGTATCYSADVSKIDSTRAMVDFAMSTYGRLDLALNNAGGHADFKPIDQTSVEESEWVIDLNFKATYYGVKFEAEAMLKTGGGVIVNNASIFGLKAVAGIGHYVASKFAVVGLTRSVALDYARANIRVNAVCPGATLTPNLLSVTGGDAHALDGTMPMGRLGTPEEVARAIVWLMSDQASYCTGSVLSVDGGMFAG